MILPFHGGLLQIWSKGHRPNFMLFWVFFFFRIIKALVTYWIPYSYSRDVSIDGLVQDCSISIANTLEILQFCSKPSHDCDSKDITTSVAKSDTFLMQKLPHCGLVMPYGDMDLGQHWLRQWLVAWWHQAITWTNVDLSSVTYSDIHLMATIQGIPHPSITVISLKITYL